MPLPVVVPEEDTVRRIRDAIEAAIPGARVEAAGSGGHYEVRVVSASFEGKGTLARQRMVYSAIAHLMKGEGALVHAIDRLETSAR